MRAGIKAIHAKPEKVNKNQEVCFAMCFKKYEAVNVHISPEMKECTCSAWVRGEERERLALVEG